MIGNQWIYHLLYGSDEDFRKIFKVKADFDSDMDRSEKALRDYAAFIGTRCREEGLRHFDRLGRRRGRRVRRAARRRPGEALHPLQRRRRHRARGQLLGRSGRRAEAVSARHVQRAEDEKCYRSNLIEERVREMITERT